MSMGNSLGNSLGNTSPLAATQSGANTPGASLGMSTALSGLSLGPGGGNSGVLMTSETVAPCLKGANKNRAKVREVLSYLLFNSNVCRK